jgi:hypothetical protein
MKPVTNPNNKEAIAITELIPNVSVGLSLKTANTKIITRPRRDIPTRDSMKYSNFRRFARDLTFNFIYNHPYFSRCFGSVAKIILLPF